MSHFAVLVIGNDIEEQLAKFNESIQMPKYVKQTKEQLIAEEKQSIEEYKNGTYAEYLADPVKYAEDKSENHVKYVSEDFPKKLEMTDEEIYQDAIKYYEPEDLGPDGETYSTYNPDSKWDWYEVGGRYAGRIVLKENAEGYYPMPNFSWGWREEDKEEILKGGDRVDEAYKKDIDFDKMHRTEEDYNEALRYWELVVEGAKPKNKKEEESVKWNWYKPEYYTERYKDKETYAKCNSSFSMWAVVKDGVWYEKGQMGWWAMSSETHDEAVDWEMNFYDRFIKDLPDNTILTIVDCHI
jgi:hypothetical protein